MHPVRRCLYVDKSGLGIAGSGATFYQNRERHAASGIKIEQVLTKDEDGDLTESADVRY